MVARGLRGAARRGRAADPVQVLLDLRFHRRRQYRPGRGGADEAARRAPSRSPARPFPPMGARSTRGISSSARLLLSDSPMKDHPLTPMRDSNLVRVLAAADATAGRARAVPDGGEGRRRDARRLRGARQGWPGHRRRATRSPTRTICARSARPSTAQPLLTGGSGIALGLPENFRRAGLLQPASGRGPSWRRRGMRRCWPEAARPRRAGR